MGVEVYVGEAGIDVSVGVGVYAASIAFKAAEVDVSAMIEATRTGLPCVVTDVGGCREVIENCKNGIVVPANDSVAMSRAIETLVREPSLLSTYSENATRLSSVYSIEQAVLRHLAVYKRLMLSVDPYSQQ